MAQRDDKVIDLDDRDPSTVRVAILARSSDTSARAEDMEGQVRQCQEFIQKMDGLRQHRATS